MAAESKGNGPPPGVAPSELWAALTALPTPHEVVDFPVKDPILGASIGKVAIVPLSPEDMMTCHKVASDWAGDFTKEKPKAGEESPSYVKIYSDEASIQVLWRALRDANDKTLEKRAFPAPVMLRRKPFTSDILAVLMRMYLRTCVTRGPIIATMSKEEMEAWVTVLEEGGSASPLDLLSREMQSDLVMHLVAQCKSLRTASTSPGSLLDGTPHVDRESPIPMPTSEDPPAVEADKFEMPKDE